MNFTLNNTNLEGSPSVGDILSTDQIGYVSTILAFSLQKAEGIFKVDIQTEDIQTIVNDTIAKMQAGEISTNDAILNMAKLVQSATDNEKLKKAMDYIIDAIGDDGKIGFIEGAISAAKVNSALKDGE